MRVTGASSAMMRPRRFFHPSFPCHQNTHYSTAYGSYCPVYTPNPWCQDPHRPRTTQSIPTTVKTSVPWPRTAPTRRNPTTIPYPTTRHCFPPPSMLHSAATQMHPMSLPPRSGTDGQRPIATPRRGFPSHPSSNVATSQDTPHTYGATTAETRGHLPRRSHRDQGTPSLSGHRRLTFGGPLHISLIERGASVFRT